LNYSKIGRTLILVGIVATFFFSFEFIFNSNILRLGPIDPGIWGQYGDIVGGFVGTIVALIGVLLLFETLKEQRLTYIKQQVETRFFELLKLHRDNVAEMHSKGNEGRNVLIDIKDEFHDLYHLVSKTYEYEKTQLPLNLWKTKVIQVAYLIVYFGVDNSSTLYLKKRINEIMSNDELYDIFEGFCLNLLISNHEKVKEQNKEKQKENRSYLRYDGHQSRLDHYYRHLFQTVKFINEQPSSLFDYTEKYNYVKILRAQLGTHEQALFLYNVISPLGEPWELAKDIVDENKKLVTKYNLIKNIPMGFTKEIEPKDYFQNVFYEIDNNPTTRRLELENIYKLPNR
jgi:hypothetical protein